MGVQISAVVCAYIAMQMLCQVISEWSNPIQCGLLEKLQKLHHREEYAPVHDGTAVSIVLDRIQSLICSLNAVLLYMLILAQGP